MRYPDWPNRLNEYIVAVRDNEFEWGVHDCCTFVAGAVTAITDDNVDIMEKFRDKYYTEIQSDEALVDIGGGTLVTALTEKFGEPVIGQRGQRGDIAIYKNCCGLMLGRYGMFVHKEGYRLVPLRSIEMAFRVS